jgi:HK97 family phage prohead protease
MTRTTPAPSAHVRRLGARVARTAARFADYARTTGAGVADLSAARLPWYEVREVPERGAAGEPATVLIFDEIGGSFGVSAEDFARDLQNIDAPVIHLRINSPGGSVFDAIAIHNALRHHPARVVAFVDALAASAASVVAMAGDEIVMMPGSQMMIHDASATEDGNSADMAKMSTFLGRQSDNIAGMYQMRGGGTVDEWRALMVDETWMFGQEAVDMGLADRVEVPEREPADAMTRSFDLSQFRYAGRRAAPTPQRKPGAIPQRPRTGMRADVQPRSRVSPAVGRMQAAQARAQTLGGLTRQAAPAARSLAFPARLRATLEDRDGQQRYHITGHASVVDTWYEMWDESGPYEEAVDGRAFDDTLAADPDVAFLTNHRGVTMARTRAGSLQIAMDSIGPAIDAWTNPKRQDVTDLVLAIQDRDVTEMSFAFMLEEGFWSKDFTRFTITRLSLDRGDVSAVNYGANPYTDVSARSREVIADVDRLPAGAAREAFDRLQERLSVVIVETDDAEADMPCPECGAMNANDAQYCDQCGAPMSGTQTGGSNATHKPTQDKGRKISHVEALLDID